MADSLRPNSNSFTPSLPTNASSSPHAPSLCVAKCGFYGNSKTENMCSKCYREEVVKREKEQQKKEDNKTEEKEQEKETTSINEDPSQETQEVQKDQTVVVDEVSVAPLDLSSTASPSSSASSSLSSSLSVPLDSTIFSSTLSAITPIPSPVLSAGNRAPSSSPSSSSSSAEFAVSLTAPLPPSMVETVSSVPAVSSEPIVAPSIASSPFTSSSSSSSSPASLAADVADVTITGSPAKKQKNRCTFCNKKVGLTFFACRCDPDGMFCVSHRYPHAHKCSFDQRKEQQQKLTSANPVVKNAQVEKL